MTAAPPKFELRRSKRALRRSMSEALGKRFSLLYLDLIMKPVPDDLKGLLIKLDFTVRPNKMFSRNSPHFTRRRLPRLALRAERACRPAAAPKQYRKIGV
jgi:hypothetical protein